MHADWYLNLESGVAVQAKTLTRKTWVMQATLMAGSRTGMHGIALLLVLLLSVMAPSVTALTPCWVRNAYYGPWAPQLPNRTATVQLDCSTGRKTFNPAPYHCTWEYSTGGGMGEPTFACFFFGG